MFRTSLWILPRRLRRCAYGSKVPRLTHSGRAALFISGLAGIHSAQYRPWCLTLLYGALHLAPCFCLPMGSLLLARAGQIGSGRLWHLPKFQEISPRTVFALEPPRLLRVMGSQIISSKPWAAGLAMPTSFTSGLQPNLWRHSLIS